MKFELGWYHERVLCNSCAAAFTVVFRPVVSSKFYCLPKRRLCGLPYEKGLICAQNVPGWDWSCRSGSWGWRHLGGYLSVDMQSLGWQFPHPPPICRKITQGEFSQPRLIQRKNTRNFYPSGQKYKDSDQLQVLKLYMKYSDWASCTCELRNQARGIWGLYMSLVLRWIRMRD